MQDAAPATPLPARREFVTSEASLRGLRCAEAHYPAGLGLARHVHEKPSLTLVAAGSLVELQGARLRPFDCAAGTVVLRPAGEPHGDAVGGRGVVNVELELEPALLASYGVVLSRPSIVALATVAALAPRLRRALRTRDRAAPLLVEGLALELLALVLVGGAAARDGARPGWLARVHDRIRDEFRADLSVAALARDAGVHPVHLARTFRTRYGTSPGELVRALRLAWAAEQLAAGERPIGAIALEAGFHDQSHLTRAFRGAMGSPPGAYRRSHRASAPSPGPPPHPSRSPNSR